MSNVNSLFVEILRFIAVAFVILATCTVGLRFLRQPLERIRLIQISLLTLFATVVCGMADVCPKIELAVLPEADSFAGADGIVNLPRQSEAAFRVGERSPQSVGIAGTDADDEARSARSGAAFSSATTSEEMSDPVGTVMGFDIMPWFRSVFVCGFLCISLLNVVYLLAGFVATKRLISSAAPLSNSAAERIGQIISELSISKRVRIVSSGRIGVPMVSCIRWPTILLPEVLTQDDADQLELKHSVAHEWAHIERHDLLTWQLASLCQPFLWIQPCYWLLRRELRLAQDQIADLYAATHTDEYATYASTLVQLSRTRQRMLPGALTMAGGKSNLYRRVEMILNEGFQMIPRTRKPVMLLLGVLITAVGSLLTSLQLTHAATPTTLVSTNQPTVNTEDEKDESKTPAKETTVTAAELTKSAEHSGVVIDADTGKPIAGATVTVTRMNSSDYRELAVTESMTDENGKYTFTIPPDQLSQSLLYIMFDVDHPAYARRHCGSYGYGMIVKNLEAGEQPWFSELKMVQGEKISGRLVDENQLPVPGAQLRSNTDPKSGRNFDMLRSAHIDGVTDRDGRFELVVPREGLTTLSIIPANHCMKFVEIGEKRGDIGEIILASGFSIHGIVQDAKGSPMEGLWVNITPEDEESKASYEMKRSSKTGAQGKFQARSVKAGKYLVEVETKATGALEKLKYANFHDEPPSAMFVRQTITVTEESAGKPFIIQAVPHVLITVQHYKPNGEISRGFSPSVMGEFDGRTVWIRKGIRTGEGAYQLMVPHGIEDVNLSFVTNEQTALMVEFEGGKLSPQDKYRYAKIEEDINNIRVVRYPAAILKVKFVDESGADLKDAGIFATYLVEKGASDEMMMSNQIGYNLEGGFLRLSSIVPNTAFTVRGSLAGFETRTETITMNEGERRSITMTLKRNATTEEKKESE